MKTKKIYLVEYCSYQNGKLGELMLGKIYANRHTAEVCFSEDYLGCLRVNNTTSKIQTHGDVIDAYSYETLSGEKIYRRLREDVMIMD